MTPADTPRSDQTVILSTDLDGTLLGRGTREIGPELPQAIKAIEAERPVIWVLNTGRRRKSGLGVLPREGSRTPDYLVDRETFLYRRAGSEYVPLTAWNEEAQAQIDAVEALAQPHLTKWASDLSDQFPQITIRFDVEVPFSVEAEDGDQGAEIRDLLVAWTQFSPAFRVIRNHKWISVWADGLDKGAVLKEVMRRHGVDPERVMAAGDNENDLPMMHPDIASWSMAPVNADETVKRYLKSRNGYISTKPDIDGVLDGLHRFPALARQASA